jgi:hypothetical protein
MGARKLYSDPNFPISTLHPLKPVTKKAAHQLNGMRLQNEDYYEKIKLSLASIALLQETINSTHLL